MKINYQLLLDQELQRFDQKKRLLLHACCGPCSSYVLEYLLPHFDITVFYYNPNITDASEYEHRALESERLTQLIADRFPEPRPVIRFARGSYDPERFLAIAKGLEDQPEGGERCLGCYRLRLEETARYAAEHHGEFDYFCTTLSVSPYKNAAKLNEIGEELAGRYGVPYLPSDFKKRGGYLRSTELSREYGLYRQDYCGCDFSRRQKHGDA